MNRCNTAIVFTCQFGHCFSCCIPFCELASFTGIENSLATKHGPSRNRWHVRGCSTRHPRNRSSSFASACEEVSMTPDKVRIKNPDDPYNREWGTGSVITVIVAIVIMAGIIAFEATKTVTNTETGTSSSISQVTTTG